MYLPHSPARAPAARLLLLGFVLLAGCGVGGGDGKLLSFVYRPDIQQGNVVEQAMLNRHSVGMSKSEVLDVMGTPLLIDPFHSNRWYYIYSLQGEGEDRRQRQVMLSFRGDRLSLVQGDVVAQLRPPPAMPDPAERVVGVPDAPDPGFLERLLGGGRRAPRTTLPEGVETIAEQARQEEVERGRTGDTSSSRDTSTTP